MLPPMQQAYQTYCKHHSENKLILIEIGVQIGDAYRILGDLKKADLILNKSIEEARIFFGKNKFAIDLLSVFMGRLLIDQKRYAEDVELLEKILKTHETK
jgi:tetratricopeptide (TPR) repeat protein